MAREENLDIDERPINPDLLATYDLDSFPGRRGDPPSEAFIFEEVPVRAPMKEREVRWAYDVEIEYSSLRGGKALDLDSISSYLDTFQEAKVTEEAMTQIIRTHLIDTLDVDDIFVEVSRSDFGVKRTRLGQP